MDLICIGKIVNTHGIKGELRLISDFKYKDLAFKKGMIIYIGSSKEKQIINSYRTHKNYDMVTIEGFNNINHVLKYKSKEVYVDKKDLNLDSGLILDEDLIGLEVYNNDEHIGTVVNVIKNPGSDLILIETKMQEERLIPYIDQFIKEINLKDNKLIVNLIEGLIE